ncbi:hypothetical protein Trydic_g17196 [Trypoxylus dichotomus]
MVSIKCSCGCNTTSSETHKFIDCCVCKKIYLHSCAELSITEIRTIKSKKGVSWSCRNCNILSSDINDLKAAILSLRNDLAAREKSAGIDDKAFEELLAELADRDNRKQNIIMFGVSESDTHDANTRRSRELETVQAVLKALPSGMNTDHIEFNYDKYWLEDTPARFAHTILELPPHHCDPKKNPIEVVWAHVRRNNTTYKAGDVVPLIDQAHGQVSREN